MKIDVIDVIQDALIGGTNGDMAFKYNNHFIRTMFDNFKFSGQGTVNGTYEQDKFREFLSEVLKESK